MSQRPYLPPLSSAPPVSFNLSQLAVARLPKESRDTICRMMQNGDLYATIIDFFARQGITLTSGHLTEWKRGGYLDW